MITFDASLESIVIKHCMLFFQPKKKSPILQGTPSVEPSLFTYVNLRKSQGKLLRIFFKKQQIHQRSLISKTDGVVVSDSSNPSRLVSCVKSY